MVSALLHTKGVNMGHAHRRFALAGAAALGVVVGGCQKQAAAADPKAIETAIKADEKKWSDEFQAKPRDSEALVSHYAQDAYFVAPGAKPASGMTEIRRVYAEGLTDPNFNISFAADKVDVAQAGDLATSQGRFEQTYTDPDSKKAVKVNGSFLTVYKKQSDGSWKVVQDWAVADPGKPTPVEPGKPATRAKMTSF
jgi:ketosteroid isomerase-like protein